MPKKTIEHAVMSRITKGEVQMKPKWYFFLGTFLSSLGLIGVSIGVLFLLNLSFFLLRQHGRMGTFRLQVMLETFPWWIPILAALGLIIGIQLLKKFDFSYKKNFAAVITVFLIGLFVAAFIIDVTGINDAWFGKGRMRRLYQTQEANEQTVQENTALLANTQTIDATTAEFLRMALEDERKALATYQATIEKFGAVKPFVNIAEAEKQHISMLLELFESYSLPVPEDNTPTPSLPSSLAEVCAIGVTAEIENDALYQKMIPQIQHQDVLTVFTALARASIEKHLPAFERCAQ